MGGSQKIGNQSFEYSDDSVNELFEGFQFGANPTKYNTYFEDFNVYTAGDFTLTETGSGTQAIADGANGLLLITNAAADNDSHENQVKSEAFIPTANKKIYFEAKFQISDATQSDLVFGLHVIETTVIDGLVDGILFRKDDGDTNLDFACVASSSESAESGIHTMVAATDVVVGFRVDGTSQVEYYVNGVSQGKIATNIPSTELAITFGIQNGEAVAKTMTVDYIFCAQER